MWFDNTWRLRRDQIEVFSIVNGYEDIDRNMFFKLKEGSRTRGHKAALVKEHVTVTRDLLFHPFCSISILNSRA